MIRPLPLAQSFVPLREPVYARYSNLFNYWLLVDKTISGRRFVIEQYGKVRDWSDPIAYGTDHVIDGVYVTAAEFDRIMRLEGVL